MRVKKYLKITFISFPLLITISGISFFLGIFISAPEDAKYMTSLIGTFAAIFAFLGVAYSKDQERKLKEDELKRIKIEEFFFNLLTYIEAIDAYRLKAALLKFRTLKDNMEDLEDRYLNLNQSLSEVSSLWAKHLMFSSIYNESITNKPIVNNLTIKHNELMEKIIHIEKMNDGDTVLTSMDNIVVIIQDIKELTTTLMKDIKINLV